MWDTEMVKDIIKNDNQHQWLKIEKLLDLLKIRYIKHIFVEFIYLFEHHVSNGKFFFNA
jgi:hypothetical protein